MDKYKLSFDLQYITVKQLHNLYENKSLNYNKEYEILGTIDTIRYAMKNTIAFVHIRTKNSIRTIQCTCPNDNLVDVWNEIWNKCSKGACFSFRGKIVNLDTSQMYEMVVSTFINLKMFLEIFMKKNHILYLVKTN